MADHYWKQHDTSPSITDKITTASGGIPTGSLSGATLKFVMRAVGSSTPVVNATAVIENPTNWTFRYDPISTDTAAAGEYQYEWELTFSGGRKQTFPDPGYNTITITADLDNA